jgi:hypothetical protein
MVESIITRITIIRITTPLRRLKTIIITITIVISTITTKELGMISEVLIIITAKVASTTTTRVLRIASIVMITMLTLPAPSLMETLVTTIPPPELTLVVTCHE